MQLMIERKVEVEEIENANGHTVHLGRDGLLTCCLPMHVDHTCCLAAWLFDIMHIAIATTVRIRMITHPQPNRRCYHRRRYHRRRYHRHPQVLHRQVPERGWPLLQDDAAGCCSDDETWGDRCHVSGSRQTHARDCRVRMVPGMERRLRSESDGRLRDEHGESCGVRVVGCEFYGVRVVGCESYGMWAAGCGLRCDLPPPPRWEEVIQIIGKT